MSFHLELKQIVLKQISEFNLSLNQELNLTEYFKFVTDNNKKQFVEFLTYDINVLITDAYLMHEENKNGIAYSFIIIVGKKYGKSGKLNVGQNKLLKIRLEYLNQNVLNFNIIKINSK